jgi:biotin synthase
MVCLPLAGKTYCFLRYEHVTTNNAIRRSNVPARRRDLLWGPAMTRDQVADLFRTPLLDLVFKAAGCHREHHRSDEVQLCTLLSVKTGGCSEDCGYCAQSAHFETGLDREGLLSLGEVVKAARAAKAGGSTRFCMGAAWRQVRDGEEFERLLEMVCNVAALEIEVCCTLGMLTEDQARRLKAAGLTAYNHNLDTGEQFYGKVVTTHSYADRLQTIGAVGRAGISVCCGGILGMGESEDDRIDLLFTLATLPTPPESIPVNAIVPVEGTPMGSHQPPSTLELVRVIAVARILVPTAMVRLSAGRDRFTEADHALCFLAGANSIFTGDKLLTTPHPGQEADAELLDLLNLKPRSPYASRR